MVDLVLMVLGESLKAWNHHKKEKLMKEYRELREDIHEERNKDIMDRDMLRYGHKLRELRELCKAYTTFVKEQNSANPS